MAFVEFLFRLQVPYKNREHGGGLFAASRIFVFLYTRAFLRVHRILSEQKTT